MWTVKKEFLNDNRVCKIKILKQNEQINFVQVIDGWKQDHNFREFYISLIANILFKAVFWETPPVSKSTLKQLYEFVLVDSVTLANIQPNPLPFQNQFNLADDESVIAFPNLTGDSMLIVPCPGKLNDYYAHLAIFLRKASNQQCHQFFQKLAVELEKKLNNNDKFLWLSTSGLGVSWLHARLDSLPKYYTFYPYKKMIM